MSNRTLLLDQGNTRVKWCVSDGGSLRERGTFSSHDNLDASVAALHAQVSAQGGAIVSAVACSVANAEKRAALQSAISAKFHVDVRFCDSQAQHGELKNGYENPGKLGADRWVAMIGARANYRGALLVVDAGTAMTIDPVSSRGEHRGGFIVPGFALQCRALNIGTDNLVIRPVSAAEVDARWGSNTQDAVTHGVLSMLAALVEKSFKVLAESEATPTTVTKYTAHQETPCRVILTGGDACAIAPLLTCPNTVDDDLLFHGLQALA